MNRSPHVLLVAPTPSVASAFSAGLTDAGLRVTLVTTFKDARQGLESCPDLLISEVRLGEYNGLHLALRAQGHNIPAIVVSETNQFTRQDAVTVGADYLEEDCTAERLQSAVRAAGVATAGRFTRRTQPAA